MCSEGTGYRLPLEPNSELRDKGDAAGFSGPLPALCPSFPRLRSHAFEATLRQVVWFAGVRNEEDALDGDKMVLSPALTPQRSRTPLPPWPANLSFCDGEYPEAAFQHLDHSGAAKGGGPDCGPGSFLSRPPSASLPLGNAAGTVLTFQAIDPVGMGM